MRILGVGLSKTGTTSLHAALQKLGYTSLHFDEIRLNDIVYGLTQDPDFSRYDDVDAVTDLPSAYFYRELLCAYPQSKAILTLRDPDSWWRSVETHMNKSKPVGRSSVSERLMNLVRPYYHRLSDSVSRSSPRERPHMPFSSGEFLRCLRNTVYGSSAATEYLYKKKFIDHNRRVRAEIPGDRLLVLNIIEGDGWDQLCEFLDRPIPDVPFPARNVTATSGAEGK